MKLYCKVITKASSNKVLGLENFSLENFSGEYLEDIKIYVTLAPEKGKANKVVLDLLSKELGVSKSSLKIVKGETSNKKIIEFDD